MNIAAGFFDEPRTFRAKTPKAALAAVKAALGPDAIIMSCEEVRKTLFNPGVIEVVARAPSALDPAALMADSHPLPPPDDEPEAPMTKAGGTPMQRAGRAFGFSTPPLHAAKPERARKSRPARKARTPSTPPLQLAPVLSPAEQLVELGLDHVLARELGEDMDPELDEDGILRTTKRALKKAVTLARAPWTPDPTTERAVLALIGPTGCGKTTTAAKIAARAMLERGLNVVLITLDHYRVGAADQLIRYGELMGVPVITASDATSFTRALDASTQADLVIVDTAGRSPQDFQILAQQTSMLRLCPEMERILVLPATCVGKPLARVQERFFSMALDRLIVTKVDESEGPSAVLNIAARLGLPLAAVCDGQNVTDDLQRVHWDWLLESFGAAQS